jgi:LAS superfamily LD-carboxypeptidase LdcB
MGNYIRSFGIIVVVIGVLSGECAISQNNVSEKALTGRDDLTLVGEGVQLQDEVYQAFLAMQKAAYKDGIAIEIVSGYRSFDRQRKIWNRKYKYYIDRGLKPIKAMNKIIEYSTIPGTSRHHWGTDIDIIDGNSNHPKDVLLQKNYENSGVYAKLKKWMDVHAEKFGFVLVYTNNPERKGFYYEPWHYSYKAISYEFLKQYRKIDIDELFKTIDIKGRVFITEKFIEKYYNENILDINPFLK